MKITYTLMTDLVCPVDGDCIPLQVEVTTQCLITVEALLDTISELSGEPSMQEPFTASLREALGPVFNVRTVGVHSGVTIVAEA